MLRRGPQQPVRSPRSCGNGVMKSGKQTTLGARATVSGIGVHSGRPASLTFHPADPNTGIETGAALYLVPQLLGDWKNGDGVQPFGPAEVEIGFVE